MKVQGPLLRIPVWRGGPISFSSPQMMASVCMLIRGCVVIRSFRRQACEPATSGGLPAVAFSLARCTQICCVADRRSEQV